MAERLNVLLVVIDSGRADHLACYGYNRDTTPFIDGMAREGVRFGAAFTTAPETLPAHASIFTGLFTATHGASDENPLLGPRRASLPEVLRRAGYRTSAFCSSPWVAPATGFGRGFDSFHTQLGDGRSMSRAAFYARRATDRLLRRSDAGARRANLSLFEWLDAGEEPFFAFLHYGEPSLRREPPASYERLFLPTEVKRGQMRAIERAWSRGEAPRQPRHDEQHRILAALYDGALRYVDARLEEVARHLIARGAWDRTLVVVTADHGQDLGEHTLAGGGRGLHDAVLRVPLILRCPPCVPQGFVVEELCQHVDLMPTILELAAVKGVLPAGHGRPLLQAGRVTAGPAFVVAERFRPDLGALRKLAPGVDLRRHDVRARALRTRREKFVWRSDEDNEFYDLMLDPGERQNRIGEEGTRAAALRAQLFDWLASLERYAPEDAGAVEESERQQA